VEGKGRCGGVCGGGGAGIQADIKACAALGAYCSSVVTAVTAQNTAGVQGIHVVPEEFIREQLNSVLSDMSVDVVSPFLPSFFFSSYLPFQVPRIFTVIIS
jgi:hydroxymethylpyrimidine kinase/phosphomethylpyrimidine kinase/thiamine-phosphate diphosphorylase